MEEKNFRDLLDETNQMIQVSDINTFEILYANKLAALLAEHPNIPYKGQKCYEYMMDMKELCPFCPLQNMAAEDSGTITEVDKGDRIFTIKTQILEWEGKMAFAEYVTDITAVKRAQESYQYEMEKLFASIPDAQGVFRLNLTHNSCLGLGNNYEKMEELRQSQTADALIRSIADRIVSQKKRQEFISVFGVDALLTAYQNGKTEIYDEAECYVTEDDLVWSRITARIMVNPSTGDRECVLYGMDISNEKSLQSNMDLFEDALMRESDTGLYTEGAFENLCREYLLADNKEAFAITILDIDYLKTVNEVCGPMIADQVIIDVARKIQVHFSNIDIIARIGDDQFAVLIKAITIDTLKDKLKWLLKKTRLIYGSIEVTSSIGAVYCERGGKDYHELIKNADQALCQAKDNGRSCFCISGYPPVGLD